MRFYKRWLSALLLVCMMLTLLPVSAAATNDVSGEPVTVEQPDIYTETKQLERFDPSTRTAYFADDTSYYVDTAVKEELNGKEGYWFLCTFEAWPDKTYITDMVLSEDRQTVPELSVDVTVTVEDVETNGDAYRVAGTNGAFEAASAFRLPVTVTVRNTAPCGLGQECAEKLELNIRSVELHVPDRFVFAWPDDRSREATLSPGEDWEYEGVITVNDDSITRQSKEVKYTVYAEVVTREETYKGEGCFTVTPVSEGAEGVQDDAYYYEGIRIPVDALDKVTDPDSAAEAVKRMTDGMTAEQKESPLGIDIATLFAETAVARAARKSVSGSVISLNDAAVADLAPEAASANRAVEAALTSGGITTSRYLSGTVTLEAQPVDKLTVNLDPSLLTAQVDKVRVETPSYALTFKLADLKDDLTEPLTITAQEAVSTYALRRTGGKTTVKIDLPKGRMTNPITVSLPYDGGDTTYQAIMKSDGSAASSKLNPVTRVMDGKVNTSGTYTPKKNEKGFADISNKSAEMQKAIRYLSSRGIISGTSATAFSPDKSINRQQIAALLMRALGKVDNTATTTFTDVPKSSSLYHAIASSQKHKVINGYSDNTFRGANVISKSQIVTVSGRVLVSEMRYKTPSNVDTYLGKYSDAVPEYAREMVALATREGLVVYRTDGTFSGAKNMTRGDAAIILYRLFQRIW